SRPLSIDPEPFRGYSPENSAKPSQFLLRSSVVFPKWPQSRIRRLHQYYVSEAKSLLENGFENYINKQVVSPGQIDPPISPSPFANPRQGEFLPICYPACRQR